MRLEEIALKDEFVSRRAGTSTRGSTMRVSTCYSSRCRSRGRGRWRSTRGVSIALTPEKTEVRIFDYVDSGVPMLVRMFEKRLRAYGASGYARGDFASDKSTPMPEHTIEYDEDLIRGVEDTE
jgi:hypothetical protein